MGNRCSSLILTTCLSMPCNAKHEGTYSNDWSSYIFKQARNTAHREMTGSFARQEHRVGWTPTESAKSNNASSLTSARMTLWATSDRSLQSAKVIIATTCRGGANVLSSPPQHVKYRPSHCR